MKSSEKHDKPIAIMYVTDTCISPPDNPKVGGAEKQLYLLATSLSSIFSPIVVQLSPFKSIPLRVGKAGNTDVFHFPTARSYSLFGLRQLSRLILLSKSKKVDIIHTFFEKSEVMGWLTALLSGIPIWVTSRRDLGFKRKQIYSKIFKFAAADCKRCIANCHAVRDQVVKEEALSENKIEVIYNGLDPSLHREPVNDNFLRKELRIKNDIPLIGIVANFYLKIKGHQYFLMAAKSILAKIQNVEFLLIGEGPLRQFYEEMALELGINNKVHFLGRRGDISGILANLNISISSSISEGFSNVILESMAASKPVVATNVGGSSEAVRDGITGYLVPPANSEAMANAIIDLLQNPDKAAAMGSAGRKVVEEKFTVEAMVKKYEKLYMSLVEEHYR